jgi:single-strand DNA-binding protein
MNKIFIIGNLTKAPELRTTQSGIPVCTFTVAVNRRQTAEAGKPDADFFRVTTWRQMAENCNRFLAKGRKVGVTGALNLNQYKDSNGLPRYSMEVTADEVEFLSPRSDADDTGMKYPPMTVIEQDDDLPF